jgi:hypothetical protein
MSLVANVEPKQLMDPYHRKMISICRSLQQQKENSPSVNHHFNKMVINHMFNSEDISNSIKEYLFITAKEKEVRENKKQVCYTINNAYLSTRKDNDLTQSWAFCEKIEGTSQFQALNCKYCGEYISTRSIDTDYLCANSAMCECGYMPLGGGVFFNYVYGSIV